MLLDVEKAPPATSSGENADHDTGVAVIFTSVEPTLRALQEAGALARRLDARVTLVVPQLVPHPLPLTSPPVLREFNERRFRIIAGATMVETDVLIYLCRDRWDALAIALKPHSLVVIGGHRRWRSSEERLARKLRRAGHVVIFLEVE